MNTATPHEFLYPTDAARAIIAAMLAKNFSGVIGLTYVLDRASSNDAGLLFYDQSGNPRFVLPVDGGDVWGGMLLSTLELTRRTKSSNPGDREYVIATISEAQAEGWYKDESGPIPYRPTTMLGVRWLARFGSESRS